MPTANLQLIYVSDIDRSVSFYEKLFETKPVFTSPRYVAFSASGEALFALWTGGDAPKAETPRYHEIGIMIGSNDDVNTLFSKWASYDEVKIIKEPYDEVFGRTFMIADPDGHMIRVSPVDG